MGCDRKLGLLATACGLVLAIAPAARADVITHGSTSITMDFVTIGDAGNTADTVVMVTDSTTGYGSVGHNYRIGTYEVSEAQWDAVIAADSNVGNAGIWSGSQATAGASWYEAAKFCNWLTSGDASLGVYTFTGSITSPTGAAINRAAAESTYGTVYFLPTEDEWYKAAYYKGGGLNVGYWDYPTQDDDPSPPDGIDSAGDPLFDAVFNDGYDQGQPNDITNAGSAGSAYGTFGQGGNVWEWNETLIGSRRGMRGGPFDRYSNFLASYYRSYSYPDLETSNLGFRVASSEVIPEPGSVTLLLSGGILALIWWRRRK